MGEWRYSSIYILNLDTSEWSVSPPGCFIFGEKPPVSVGWEDGWATEPVWKG